MENRKTVYYHLPGLFEHFVFYKEFLPFYTKHREYFYDWCEIGSIYGSPEQCIWAGGRVGSGAADFKEVLALLEEYKISPRLTFSNSLLKEEHLKDENCNRLCGILDQFKAGEKGIILHSDLLLSYLKNRYPDFYFVSSTTKVLERFSDLVKELDREEFSFVVPDFRLNKAFKELNTLTEKQKDKVEFLCNECCDYGCKERKVCYERVSRLNLGESMPEYVCKAALNNQGYRFSRAMMNPGFIGTGDILNTYLPMGFHHFKIEGRNLGSAILLEFLLYYMTKPEYQLNVREGLYLDSDLDLF